MTIYNARPIQRLLITLSGLALWMPYSLIFFFGKLYYNEDDLKLMFVLTPSIIIGCIIAYFLFTQFAKSIFYFDKIGITRQYNGKIVLSIKWEDVVGIGATQLYDCILFHHLFQWGPSYMIISYINSDEKEESIQVAFSKKDLKKLKNTFLNPKLENIQFHT